ncbi:hypothetical protein JW848_02830 [Candidatus Bipolaricaulota bacterium]|nr:hypothetical protein [Candidatus Bipolaricaulota bacterium]
MDQHQRQDLYEVELIDLLRVMWRRKWSIVAVTVLIVAMVAGFAATRTPTYEATLTLSLDNRAPEFATALSTAESAAGRQGSSTLSGQLAAWASLCITARPPFVDRQQDTFEVTAEIQGIDVVFTLSRKGFHAINEAVNAWTPWIQATMTSCVSHDLDLLRNALVEDLAQQEAVLAEIIAVLPEESFRNPALSDADPDHSATTEAFADQLATQQLRVAHDRVALAALDQLSPEDLFSVQEVERTNAVVTSIGLVTYLGVGIVLGLLFGVLFAFFVDYLVRARKR